MAQSGLTQCSSPPAHGGLGLLTHRKPLMEGKRVAKETQIQYSWPKGKRIPDPEPRDAG